MSSQHVGNATCKLCTIVVESTRALPVCSSKTKEAWVSAMRAALVGIVSGGAGSLDAGNGFDYLQVIDGTDIDYSANTITFSDHATANDTVTIGAITFTGKSSASSDTEFTVGTTATATASNLAAKINAHGKLAQLITASSALGVLTVLCNIPGSPGDCIPLSAVCSVATIGGGGVALEGGGTSNSSYIPE